MSGCTASKTVSAQTPVTEVADVETHLLLEAVFLRSGFDFRNYAPTFVRRRFLKSVQEEGTKTISGLQERVLHDPEAMERLLLALSVTATSMFRDPTFFRSLREEVVPLLRTYPFARIWVAGCSTGAELYSLAILLKEEAVYDRCQIYATDMNDNVLSKAQAGVFHPSLMQEYTRNYLDAGGTGEFSAYYTARYGNVIMRSSLRDNVTFAQHNLASDGPFNEFNLILCRNVMIYFDKTLQERAHGLLHQSLARFGVLGLGDKESIRSSPHREHYEELNHKDRLYRRIR